MVVLFCSVINNSKQYIDLPHNRSQYIFFSLELYRIIFLTSSVSLLDMEIRNNSFSLSDDSKSILSRDNYRQSNALSAREQIVQNNEIDPEDEMQLKYFEEFKKIYFTSFKLHNQIKKQMRNKDLLFSRIVQIQTQITSLHKSKRQEDFEQQNEQNEQNSKRKINKRTRRTAQEIQRKYYCQAQYCDRCYGSQGSLQQHIKLKHPELYKKQNDSQAYS